LLCSPRRTRQLREGNVDVGARLRRQSEHALADDVPLDLVRAAPDRDRGAGEEQRLPLAVADPGDPVRAGDPVRPEFEEVA